MNADNGKDEKAIRESDFERRLLEGLHSVQVPLELKSKLTQRIRFEAAWDVDSPAALVDEHSSTTSAGKIDVMAGSALTAAESTADMHSNEDADSQVSPSPTASKPDSAVRRRRWQTSAVLATSAAILLFMLGWSWIGRSAAPQLLASHCVQELESLGLLGDQQDLPEFPAHVKQFVWQHLSLSQPSLEGQRVCDSGDFGSSAQVWKLSDRRGAVYVFVFEAPPAVSGLTSQLRVIQDSGPLSLAACSTGEHLFVVATAEDVRQFFRTASFA